MAKLPPEFEIDEAPQPLPIEARPAALRDKVVALIRRHADLADELRVIERQADRKQRKFFLSLLEVADAFDRIFHNTDLSELDEAARSRLRSLKATSTLLANVFDKEDVTPMEDLESQLFDPHTQEIVAVEEQADVDDEIVLLVKQRGYYWRGKVLRRAQVVVSKRA